jgi:hypothetical protein
VNYDTPSDHYQSISTREPKKLAGTMHAGGFLEWPAEKLASHRWSKIPLPTPKWEKEEREGVEWGVDGFF